MTICVGILSLQHNHKANKQVNNQHTHMFTNQSFLHPKDPTGIQCVLCECIQMHIDMF